MKTTVLRRGSAALALVVTATLALSGCLYSMIPDDTVGAREFKPPSTVGVPAGLESFYGQEVDWQTCDGMPAQYQCGTVEVPLDYDDPSARSIDLAVVRHVAPGPDVVGSLLTNPGGPGGSGLSYIRDSLDYAMGSALVDNFDIIGFDPRGVGESTAVHCLDGKAMDAYLYDLPKNERDSDAWQDEMDANAATFAQACEDNSDGILEFITTENAARDMDVLRAVLGDDELFYYGASYGTFLGATYAKLFPKIAGRLVLDGALDPAARDVGTIQAIGFEDALKAYMASCLKKSSCPFSGTVDQAMKDLNTLLHTVDRSPLEAKDGRMLGADSLLTGVIAALYSEGNWRYLTDALNGALEGDPTMAFALGDMYNGRIGPGAYSDNSTEAFNAYNCMDYPDDYTQEELDASMAVVKEKAPTIADFWGGGDVCASWAFPPTGKREPIAAPGTKPIVVVGTTNDPATPYQWAVSLADQLEGGVLVTREGEGHTGYGMGSSCTDSAIEDYLIDGTVPENGLTCN